MATSRGVRPALVSTSSLAPFSTRNFTIEFAPRRAGAVEGGVAVLGGSVDVEAEFGAEFDGFKGFGFVALDLVSPIHPEATLSAVRPFLLASFGSALFSRRSFMSATSAPRAARMKALAPAFMVRAPVSCAPFAIGEAAVS